MNLVTALYAGEDIAANDLVNPAWDRCETVRIERLWSGELASPERHAEVAIVWTRQSLNVRYICSQKEPLVVSELPITTSKTLGLWIEMCARYSSRPILIISGTTSNSKQLLLESGLILVFRFQNLVE